MRKEQPHTQQDEYPGWKNRQNPRDCRRRIGDAGEFLAAAILKQEGYHVIKRNFVCKWGELDIIAKKENTLVFVEVKTRLNDQYGSGREAVDERKKRHIRNCAQDFLSQTCLPYDQIEFLVAEITAELIRGAEI